MSTRRIWFITGAGRGRGVDFAKAALVDALPDRSTSLAFDEGARK
jgi:hypothetical protein